MACSSADSSIPDDAKEVLQRSYPDGQQVFDCVVNGQTIAYRVRDAYGALLMECGLKDGVRDGVEHHWEPDGSLTFETHWLAGKEHGVARQWWQGKLVGTYAMNHGTGVDLWRDSEGSLSEERHYLDGERHGFERWWRDKKTVWEEGHFRRDVEHGVFRLWNEQGRLRRGYPNYYVDGKQVSKRQYLRACALDPSLPPFREEDNRAQRDLPDAYVTPQQQPEASE